MLWTHLRETPSLAKAPWGEESIITFKARSIQEAINSCYWCRKRTLEVDWENDENT